MNTEVIKSFTTPWWLKVQMVGLVILFGSFVLLSATKGWLLVVLAVFFALLVRELIVLFLDGVVIKEDVLVITKNASKMIIRRGEVTLVDWGRGWYWGWGRITIEYNQSNKVSLPDINSSPEDFSNEIMNWNQK